MNVFNAPRPKRRSGISAERQREQQRWAWCVTRAFASHTCESLTLARARACRPRREAAAQRPSGGAAAAAANETETVGEIVNNDNNNGERVAAHDVQLTLGAEEANDGGETPSPTTTPKADASPRPILDRRLSSKFSSCFGSSSGDDEAAARGEVPEDDTPEEDEGALPDPSDRAAFEAYTVMITARECIAVAARRAELAQAVAHLEVGREAVPGQAFQPAAQGPDRVVMRESVGLSLKGLRFTQSPSPPRSPIVVCDRDARGERARRQLDRGGRAPAQGREEAAARLREALEVHSARLRRGRGRLAVARGVQLHVGRRDG